jgi:predicted transcriptional regulator of viral defense system
MNSNETPPIINLPALLSTITQNHQYVLRPREIEAAIIATARAVGIHRIEVKAIINRLIDAGLVKKIAIRFPTRSETRYSLVASPSPLQVALSIGRESYLSHATALFVHGLIRNLPNPIYVNEEQRAKGWNQSDLTQEGINSAFRRPPRTSSNIAKFQRRSICLINGKHTGNLGVINQTGKDGFPLRVTDIERTLIDIVVRPKYSGAPKQLLSAYRRAGNRASLPRILNLLEEIAHVYPYHQSIGFLAERSGAFRPEQLESVKSVPRELDFYLMNEMDSPLYSPEWRIFYPRELNGN